MSDLTAFKTDFDILILSLLDYQVDMLLNEVQQEIDWDDFNKVHNWKNYIPFEVRKFWSQLSFSAQFALAVMAEIQADNEEWD